MISITLFYSSILAVWLIILSARVVVYRRQNLVEIGSGEGRTLEFRIRAQGNLAEYAPFALLLLMLLELGGTPNWVLHGLGVMLVSGRLMHGWSFSFANGLMRARVVGMALTFMMIAIAALIGLGTALAQLVSP